MYLNMKHLRYCLAQNKCDVFQVKFNNNNKKKLLNFT